MEASRTASFALFKSNFPIIDKGNSQGWIQEFLVGGYELTKELTKYFTILKMPRLSQAHVFFFYILTLPLCVYIYIHTQIQSNLNTNQISNPVVLAVNLAALYIFSLWACYSTPNMS